MLLAIGAQTVLANDPASAHPFVHRIESIQIPPLDIADATPSEIFEFVRIKMKDWEAEPDPRKKGFSIIILDLPMDDTRHFNYKRSACSARTFFQDLATLLNVDIHVTEVGVVITQVEKSPFPNPKAPTAAILKTYHARSKP